MRPSYQQVLRYLQWFQSERRAQYLMLVSPKDYRNKIELAIGRLDQDLAPNQRWQLDFTRNDVLLRMPGIDQPQRFAVGMVLDVATRRRKVLLSPVPKDETTALLLLGAIEEWGVPTEIRPDNGKEFINKRVQSLCQALGIIINPCIPGRPQEKGNVERGLGDLVRRMQTQPSFVGHNVLQRQQIREAKGEQYLLEAAPSFDEFQAWLDQQIEEIHETPHNGVGMEGMSPNERLDDFIARGWQPTVATLEAAELRRLVYSAEVTARRDCIVWKTRRYITEHLAQVSAGDRLRVCMDGNDLRQIHIYSLDMQTYYGVARWEICLSKKELIAAAERGKALQRGSHKASKAGAKEGAKIAAKWQERPDLAVGAHSTQAAAQQVSAAHAAALRDELSSAVDTPPPVGDNRPQLVVVRSAPTPEPAAADEEPDFWNDRWIWAAWQYKRGDWKTDDRKRQDMVERFLEHPFLTAHQLGMKEDPDGFAAIGEEIGMTWMEKEKLRSELEQHQRTQQLIAEQARRRFG
jgi:transposase InsO family protein